MRIKANDMLFGHPTLRIRRLLRRAMFGVSMGFIQQDLAIDQKSARTLLKELEAAGYLEKRDAREGGWRTTVKGNAMAIAAAGSPLKRSTGERLLVEFLERVEQVRDQPEWLFKVQTATLFGSFLSDSSTLGDIDVGLSLRPAHEDKREQDAAERELRDAAAKSGRRFSNYIDYLFWPENEVRRFLRARRRISLHDPRTDAAIIQAGRHVTVYQDEQVVRGSIPLLDNWPAQ